MLENSTHGRDRGDCKAQGLRSRLPRLLLTGLSALAGVALLEGPAFASGESFSNPGVSATFNLSAGSTLVLKANIDDEAVTYTCTNFDATGYVPGTGLKISFSGAPLVSGCTDSFGGTDTVISRAGWSFSVNGKGTRAAIDLPKDGVEITSSALTGCTVTGGHGSVKGSYNDLNTETVTGAAIKASAVGCTTQPKLSAFMKVTIDPNEWPKPKE